MYDEYESGIFLDDHVKAEVIAANNEKLVLNVDPVGKFNPGGCTASVIIRKEELLAITEAEEFYDYLLNRIIFENLEGIIDIGNTDLKSVIEYTRDLRPDDSNSWWLNYFKKLDEDLIRFHESLLKAELHIVKLHQYHSAYGELCDFVDYTCCPQGEDQETIRNYLESSLTPESRIDEIMELFEDGFFYGSGYKADETVAIDYRNGDYIKTLTVSDVR